MRFAPFETPCALGCLDYEIVIEIFKISFCLKRKLPHIGADEIHLYGFLVIARTEQCSRAAKIYAFSPISVVIDVESDFHENYVLSLIYPHLDVPQLVQIRHPS